MPIKDDEKRRKYRREWYAKNKESERAHIKRRRIELKKWFQGYKKKLVCSVCGENHPATIEFHHKFNNKEKNISLMVNDGYSTKRIMDEINKCLVLCSNCHRKEHFKLRLCVR